jgi:diguanylate cyclase (GGDEF)-like protein/PAS domain S-box-containing protein
MKLTPVRSRRWLLLALFVGLVGGLLAWRLQREHARIEMVERERLTTQSKVIEVNLTRQLTAIQLSLESIISELPYWAGLQDGQVQAIRRLKSMEAAMPAVRTFLILDAQGNVTLSNRDELMGRNFSQRDYFQVPFRSGSTKTLFISEPFKSVLGNFVINVTRVVAGPNGKFAGIVSAAVDPVDIGILLNSVRYADDMRATLVHGDGKVFVMQPLVNEVMGANLSAPGTLFSRHLQSNDPVSIFNGESYSTGDALLMVLRTVAPPTLVMDKPLVLTVSRNLNALYAEWWSDARNQAMLYGLLVLATGGLWWMFSRQRDQRQVSEKRLKLATEAAGVGIWEFDLNSRCYHWDGAMFELFGLDPQMVNVRNDDWHQLMLPGEFERIRAATVAVLKSRQVIDVTFKILRPDGEVRFMRNRAALHMDDSDVPNRLIGTTEDVTERKLTEADLRIAATAFECQEGILVTNAKQMILRVNRAFSDQFGYTAEEAIGQTPRILKSDRHDKAFYQAMWAAIDKRGAWQGEVWNRRKNGEVFPEWLTITAVFEAAGQVSHYVATHTDITLRKAAEDEIRHLAFYDPLTLLPNRRLLRDRLKLALMHVKREHKQLALIFVDLDKFKPVNDQHGHAMGDMLLQGVAHRISACVRESDTVARIGGDEFVLLLPEITRADDALLVAEKVHAALRQPFVLPQGLSVTISSSAGVALYPDHGADEATLTQSADAAMYQAKVAGRDRYVVFDPAADIAVPSGTGVGMPTKKVN